MEPIYPISALSKDTAAVREEARRGLVRITENGRGAYVFCSEEALEDYVERRIADALLEQRVSEALDRSIAELDAGQGIPAEEGRRRVAAVREANAFGIAN